MGFFDDEPDVAPAPAAEPPRPARAVWLGPPEDVPGVLVPLDAVVTRTPNAVVFLVGARAYPNGCQVEVRVAARRDGLAEDAWWELHDGLFGAHRRRWNRDPSTESAPHFSVRLTDGTEVAAVGSAPEEQPAGPLLVCSPDGGTADSGTVDSHFQLWLHPLPDTGFELRVEWASAAVDTTARVDGAAIAAAAERAQPYWP
ncbi:hypothetical protein M8C13_09300 [Crossiella sp. SN42]|uniref:hypothetical protein n=1 Tax=Crossiella sp. SN42 TaxID=2944808 RepID=UPI00207D688B|nr:hypothetical protein [Crossiella sp. SN42]MCO1575951.1 hypothetical protein [Crossiella sp. SN42]